MPAPRGRSARLTHLVRRFAGSLSRRPPAPDDEAWANSLLTAGECELWRRLGAIDRRHAIVVARRFAERRGTASREEMAAALLHDVGKLDADLGTMHRVVATIVGPRTDRYRRYHDHERIGAQLLERAGSSPATVELVTRHGPAADTLREADDV